MQPIFQALKKGFKPQDIINFLLKKYPNQSEKIKKALTAGYSAEQILSYITKGAYQEEPIESGGTLYEQTRNREEAKKENRNNIALKGAALAASTAIAPTAVAALQRALPSQLANLAPTAFQQAASQVAQSSPLNQTPPNLAPVQPGMTNTPQNTGNIQNTLPQGISQNPPIVNTNNTDLVNNNQLPENILNEEITKRQKPDYVTILDMLGIREKIERMRMAGVPPKQIKKSAEKMISAEYREELQKLGPDYLSNILDDYLKKPPTMHKGILPEGQENKLPDWLEGSNTYQPKEASKITNSNNYKIKTGFEDKSEEEILDSAREKLVINDFRNRKNIEEKPKEKKVFYHVVPENYKVGDPIYSAEDYEKISGKKIDFEEKWPDYSDYRDSEDFRNVTITSHYDVAYEYLKNQLNNKGKIIAFELSPNDKFIHNFEGFLMTPRIPAENILGEVPLPKEANVKPFDIEETNEENLPFPKKGETAFTPKGIGQVIEERNGKYLVEVDGKKFQVSKDEIESAPAEKDVASLFDELQEEIKKTTGQEISRAVSFAGYDDKQNSLAFLPHDGAMYVYTNIPDDLKERIKSLLGKRKTSGENFIGAWTEGTESPAGSEMQKIIQLLQSQRGGKGSEYAYKFDSVYNFLEAAYKAKKRKKK